jgi:hypothetical protein
MQEASRRVQSASRVEAEFRAAAGNLLVRSRFPVPRILQRRQANDG